jgi:hypothetical protein
VAAAGIGDFIPGCLAFGPGRRRTRHLQVLANWIEQGPPPCQTVLVSAGAGDDGAGDRVINALFRLGRAPEDLFCSPAWRRFDGGDAWPSGGQGARLVEDDPAGGTQAFERCRITNKDPVSRSSGCGRYEGWRCRDAKRTRAGDDEACSKTAAAHRRRWRRWRARGLRGAELRAAPLVRQKMRTWRSVQAPAMARPTALLLPACRHGDALPV